jgi:hypothetical protein
MGLLPIAPGNSPQFRLTPDPAGVPTSIDQIGWAVECSDGSSVTVTSNASDATGMTATLRIPSTTKAGAVITMWCVYRNPDETEILGGPWKLTVV